MFRQRQDRQLNANLRSTPIFCETKYGFHVFVTEYVKGRIGDLRVSGNSAA
jgi:hypothetical protein